AAMANFQQALRGAIKKGSQIHFSYPQLEPLWYAVSLRQRMEFGTSTESFFISRQAIALQDQVSDD
ncbi:hypothetical protein ABTK63_21090, partial [Acinetobacter baumannii]